MEKESLVTMDHLTIQDMSIAELKKYTKEELISLIGMQALELHEQEMKIYELSWK